MAGTNELISISEEDVQDFRFKELRKIRFGNSGVEDCRDQRFSLLCTSNHFGFTFVGCKAGVFVFQTALLYEVDRDENLGKRNMIAEKSNLGPTHIATPAPPINIGLSCDNLTLSVCVRENELVRIYFYDTRALSTKGKSMEPFCNITLTTDKAARLEDLQWNPGFPNFLVTVLSTGTVNILEVTNNVSVIVQRKGIQANCVCWSPKGKQFALGLKTGDVIQCSVKGFEEKRRHPQPPSQDDPSKPMQVADLHWLSPFEFVVTYTPQDQNDINTLVVFLSCPKDQPPSYNVIEDPYGYFAVDQSQKCVDKFYFSYIPRWSVLVTCSNNSVDTPCFAREGGAHSVLGNASRDQPDDYHGPWWLWCLDEGGRVEPPLDSNDNETHSVGVVIDYTSQETIPINDTKILPCAPLFLSLTDKGVLCPYTVINTGCSPDKITELMAPPKPLPSSPVRQPDTTTPSTQPKTAPATNSIPLGNGPKATPNTSSPVTSSTGDVQTTVPNLGGGSVPFKLTGGPGLSLFTQKSLSHQTSQGQPTPGTGNSSNLGGGLNLGSGLNLGGGGLSLGTGASTSSGSMTKAGGGLLLSGGLLQLGNVQSPATTTNTTTLLSLNNPGSSLFSLSSVSSATNTALSPPHSTQPPSFSSGPGTIPGLGLKTTPASTSVTPTGTAGLGLKLGVAPPTATMQKSPLGGLSTTTAVLSGPQTGPPPLSGGGLTTTPLGGPPPPSGGGLTTTLLGRPPPPGGVGLTTTTLGGPPPPSRGGLTTTLLGGPPPPGGVGLTTATLGGPPPPSGGGLTTTLLGGPPPPGGVGLTTAPLGGPPPPSGGGLTTTPLGGPLPPSGGGLTTAPLGGPRAGPPPPSGGGLTTAPLGGPRAAPPPPRGGGLTTMLLGGPPPPGGRGLTTAPLGGPPSLSGGGLTTIPLGGIQAGPPKLGGGGLSFSGAAGLLKTGPLASTQAAPPKSEAAAQNTPSVGVPAKVQQPSPHSVATRPPTETQAVARPPKEASRKNTAAKEDADSAEAVEKRFAAEISQEIEKFSEELDALNDEVLSLGSVEEGTVADLGSTNDLIAFSRDTNALEDNMANLTNTFQVCDHSCEHCKEETFRGFEMYEEARANVEKRKDPKFASLLKVRPLDSYSTKRLYDLRASFLQVSRAIDEVNSQLDSQLERKYEEKRQRGKNLLKAPSIQTVYSTLRDQNRIIRLQNDSMATVIKDMKKLKLIPGSWRVAVPQPSPPRPNTSPYQSDSTPRRFNATPHRFDHTHQQHTLLEECEGSPARMLCSGGRERLRECLEGIKKTPVKKVEKAQIPVFRNQGKSETSQTSTLSFTSEQSVTTLCTESVVTTELGSHPELSSRPGSPLLPSAQQLQTLNSLSQSSIGSFKPQIMVSSQGKTLYRDKVGTFKEVGQGSSTHPSRESSVYDFIVGADGRSANRGKDGKFIPATVITTQPQSHIETGHVILGMDHMTRNTTSTGSSTIHWGSPPTKTDTQPKTKPLVSLVPSLPTYSPPTATGHLDQSSSLRRTSPHSDLSQIRPPSSEEQSGLIPNTSLSVPNMAPNKLQDANHLLSTQMKETYGSLPQVQIASKPPASIQPPPNVSFQLGNSSLSRSVPPVSSSPPSAGTSSHIPQLTTASNQSTAGVKPFQVQSLFAHSTTLAGPSQFPSLAKTTFITPKTTTPVTTPLSFPSAATLSLIPSQTVPSQQMNTADKTASSSLPSLKPVFGIPFTGVAKTVTSGTTKPLATLTTSSSTAKPPFQFGISMPMGSFTFGTSSSTSINLSKGTSGLSLFGGKKPEDTNAPGTGVSTVNNEQTSNTLPVQIKKDSIEDTSKKIEEINKTQPSSLGNGSKQRSTVQPIIPQANPQLADKELPSSFTPVTPGTPTQSAPNPPTQLASDPPTQSAPTQLASDPPTQSAPTQLASDPPTQLASDPPTQSAPTQLAFDPPTQSAPTQLASDLPTQSAPTQLASDPPTQSAPTQLASDPPTQSTPDRPIQSTPIPSTQSISSSLISKVCDQSIFSLTGPSTQQTMKASAPAISIAATTSLATSAQPAVPTVSTPGLTSLLTSSLATFAPKKELETSAVSIAGGVDKGGMNSKEDEVVGSSSGNGGADGRGSNEGDDEEMIGDDMEPIDDSTGQNTTSFPVSAPSGGGLLMGLGRRPPTNVTANPFGTPSTCTMTSPPNQSGLLRSSAFGQNFQPSQQASGNMFGNSGSAPPSGAAGVMTSSLGGGFMFGQKASFGSPPNINTNPSLSLSSGRIFGTGGTSGQIGGSSFGGYQSSLSFGGLANTGGGLGASPTIFGGGSSAGSGFSSLAGSNQGSGTEMSTSGTKSSNFSGSSFSSWR